jgi:hypothetical protein
MGVFSILGADMSRKLTTITPLPKDLERWLVNRWWKEINNGIEMPRGKKKPRHYGDEVKTEEKE